MSSHLVIAKIGTIEELRRSATSDDMHLVEAFGSENRQREALAWRAIVRRELGAECRISYDEWGAPQVDLPNTFISVSHSKEQVAVLFSDAPCAVDIEQTERDFARVASRYLSDNEQSLAELHKLHAELWCAKEALYKYHKRGGLDLRRDIKIVEYDSEKSRFVATILDGEDIEVALSRQADIVVAQIG